MKSILKKAFIFFSCGLVFFFGAYAYLHFNLDKNTAAADQKDYTVPYEKKPENAGVAFVFPDSSAVLVFLDFENSGIKLLEIEVFDSGQTQYYGYTADYTVQGDYQLLSGLIDRVGGVSLTFDGETLRYTGEQVVELIASGRVSQIERPLISQIFEQISKNGFSREDLVYITENSRSDLSVIDCIYWLDYIKEMSGRVVFVN